MADFNLEQEDIVLLRHTWSHIQSKSKNGYKEFCNRLFANLIVSNPPLKKLFNSERVARQHANYMGEVISFTLAYLDDRRTLNDCTSRFLKENPDLYKLGIHYIEPLGVSFIQTLHQVLPKSKLTPQLEGSWVKVYLQLVNNILRCSDSDESDSQSLISVEREEVYQPPTPPPSNDIPKRSHARQASQDFGPTKVVFQLKNNDKYKGFRRSAQEPVDMELQAEVPPRSSSRNVSVQGMSPVSNSSDHGSPTSSRNASIEAFNPRVARKSLSLSNLRQETGFQEEMDLKTIKQEPLRKNTFKVVSYSNSSEESLDAPEQNTPFSVRDPRISSTTSAPFNPRSRSQGYSSGVATPAESDVESVYSTTAPLFSGKTSKSASASTDEEAALMEELMNMNAPKRNEARVEENLSASPSVPYGQGLTPISEFEDDTTSSKYDSENDETVDTASSGYRRSISHDEVSSGISSLSLDHTNDKASFTSGNSSPTSSPAQTAKVMPITHSRRTASCVSEISYMKPLDIPEPRTTYCKPASQYRVSAGFMKSSFVLQKVLEQQTASGRSPQPQYAQQKSAGSGVVKQTHNAVTSPSLQMQGALKPPVMPVVAEQRTVRTPEVMSDEEDDCLDLINLFVPVTAAKKNVKGPNYTQRVQNSAPLSRRLTNTSINSQPLVLDCDKSKRSSVSNFLGFSKPSSRLSSMVSHKNSDACSIMSNESLRSMFSDFSFMSKAGSRRSESKEPRRATHNKYENKVKSSRFSFFKATVKV